MGGFGSGKWMDVVKRNSAVDYSMAINVKMLKKFGFFDCDKVGVIEWRNQTGEIVCSVQVETSLSADVDKTPAVTLRRQVSSTEIIEQKIRLSTSPCTYGGFRWWFECPVVKDGVYCGNRASKLYLPSGQLYFGCRACHDLTYESCQKSHKYDNLFEHIENAGVDSLSVTQALRLGGL